MIKYWQPGGNEGPNDGEDNKPEGEIQKCFLSILTWMTGSDSRLKTIFWRKRKPTSSGNMSRKDGNQE